ncbi:MAG: DUF4956 domain-containing protein [Eubacterium sp.]|nr:DUF4956 domain-containing protein [Eubacterium sp.]
MFSTILDTSNGTLSISSAAICFGTALILGLIISLVYMKSSDHYTKSFVVTLALLPALVEAVILMTSGSLGSAVAVLGTFSLVRFRSAPGTSKEILSIFFAMAVGLACGMGQILFAVMITTVIALLFILLMKSGFAGNDREFRSLKVTIPEDLDYTGIFDDIFREYTRKSSLERVKTVNLGSMYELNYRICLKDQKKEKEMIDNIRTRNGNLSIVCGKIAENIQEL